MKAAPWAVPGGWIARLPGPPPLPVGSDVVPAVFIRRDPGINLVGDGTVQGKRSHTVSSEQASRNLEITESVAARNGYYILSMHKH